MGLARSSRFAVPSSPCRHGQRHGECQDADDRCDHEHRDPAGRQADGQNDQNRHHDGDVEKTLRYRLFLRPDDACELQGSPEPGPFRGVARFGFFRVHPAHRSSGAWLLSAPVFIRMQRAASAPPFGEFAKPDGASRRCDRCPPRGESERGTEVLGDALEHARSVAHALLFGGAHPSPGTAMVGVFPLGQAHRRQPVNLPSLSGASVRQGRAAGQQEPRSPVRVPLRIRTRSGPSAFHHHLVDGEEDDPSACHPLPGSYPPRRRSVVDSGDSRRGGDPVSLSSGTDRLTLPGRTGGGATSPGTPPPTPRRCGPS